MRPQLAVAILLAGGATAAQSPSAPQGRSALPRALARADRVEVGPVETEMRNVYFRVDDRIILRIHQLRGVLRPAAPGVPPWFDDPASFTLSIDSGDVGITPASLGALLNGYTFNYPGSPLKQLQLSIEEGQLKQSGVLHKVIDLPFTIRATLSAAPDGRLRLHPTSVKVIGIPVGGLMDLFGLELENLVKVRRGRGIEVSGDDFLLSPSGLLPSPRIEGRVRTVRIQGGEIRQHFGASRRPGAALPLRPPDTLAKNYLFYRGGVLRFGKLTMVDADLQIVDADPGDPFEFYLANLNRQLVAGESHNQTDFGLVTVIPDWNDLTRRPSTR